jgi:cation transport ATPase
MQEGASVALRFPRSSELTVGGARTASPSLPESLGPIARLSPISVSFKSDLLSGPDSEATAREFLIRAFSVDEVDEVAFRRRQSRIDVRLNPSATHSEAWPKLAAALRDASRRGAARRDRLARQVASLQLVEMGAETAVRVSRFGDALTTWRVAHHSRDRLRFSHPALRRRRDVLHHFRMELASIYGVEALTTNLLTSSVWVSFDPDLIEAEQIVGAIEKSWSRLLEEITPPLPPGKLIAAGGLLAFASTAQFFRPALSPYAVGAVVLYGLPNVIQAVRDLARGKIGLPMLYSTITTFVILSGSPFPSAVMAVFMQSWPRLSERVALAYDRRLFHNSRRRFVWARTRQSDLVESRTDIDRLSAGDVIHLRAGDYVPVDGVVADGFGAVDEDMLTGVMGAIDKSPGDAVYASTYLRTGTLDVRVSREGGASSSSVIAASLPIGPISHLPSSAEVERVANRNAKPAVAVAWLNLLATGALRVSQGLIRADYATAPRLSAQLSVVTGIAEGMRDGIFLRSPSALDRMLGANLFVFDESAGLERAQVAVAAIGAAHKEDAQKVLSIATAAFVRRGDARAKALREESDRRQTLLPQIQQRRRLAGAIRFEDESGELLEVATTAYVERAALTIPDVLAPFLAEAGVELDPNLDPRDPDVRPLWVARAGRVIGVITFERKEPIGRSVIETLRRRNPKNSFLYISSASQKKARAAAEASGIETAIGRLDASAKANAIRELSRRAIWIGDGSVPEAQAAIAASSVSVSVGGVPTLLDDRADVILLQGDLEGLVAVRKLARAHLARLRDDFRKVYTANLLGTAGAFVANFGSLEANLTTNFGSGLILATRWSDLRRLARAFERRDAIRLSAPTEELGLEHLGPATRDTREEDLIEFPEPVETPQLDGV